MTRLGRAATLALISVVLIAAQTASEGTDVQVVDVSNYPLTRIIFTPPDEVRGTDLTVDDVTLLQDGEPVEIILRALEAEPVEVVLAIDTSGSMQGAPLTAAKDAAIGFVNQMPSGSDIAVVTFGGASAVVAEFGTPTDELETAIGELQAASETALYDAVVEAAFLVEAGPRARQFIIVLTDGSDTASFSSLDDVLSALDPIDVGFFAIALEGLEFDPTALEQMSGVADGVVAEASNSGALAELYTGIAIELASQYSIVFQPIAGGTTTFDVVVDTPSGPSTDSFTISLPALSGSAIGGSGTVTTTTFAIPEPAGSAARSFTPPPVRTVGEPGTFAQEWARTVGIGALFIVFLLAFALALKPQEGRRERRHGVLDPGEAGARGRRTVFTRLRSRFEERFDARESARDERGPGSMETALEAAGVALRPGEFAFMSTVAAILGFLLGIALGSFALAVLIAAGGVFGPRLWLASAAAKRRIEFGDQLEGTLQLIAGSLRAGYGVGQAINTVATESAEPTQSEFARVVVETRLGRDLDDALDALASRMDNQDLRWVTDAIEIQRGVGGDLAEVLDKVSSTIRDRNQIKRQVYALTAEGRLSAIILIALPFGLAGFISLSNPSYLGELTSTFPGRVMLIGGAVLMTLGVVWIRRLIRIEF